MAVTRSGSVERAASGDLPGQRAAWRGRELLLTVVAGLSAKRLLNLNELGAREELIPALTPYFPNSGERDAAARDIYYLTGSLPNVGGIARKKLLTSEQFRQLKPLMVV